MWSAQRFFYYSPIRQLCFLVWNEANCDDGCGEDGGGIHVRLIMGWKTHPPGLPPQRCCCALSGVWAPQGKWWPWTRFIARCDGWWWTSQLKSSIERYWRDEIHGVCLNSIFLYAWCWRYVKLRQGSPTLLNHRAASMGAKGNQFAEWKWHTISVSPELCSWVALIFSCVFFTVPGEKRFIDFFWAAIRRKLVMWPSKSRLLTSVCETISIF